MTCSEQEEDLAPDEASGVLCRCGHLLTDSDLHFCGYCGSVIQVTRGRRQAPAAVVSGRRAALAALASERNAVPVDPVTDRFVAPPVRALHPLPPPPAAPAPPVTVLAAPAPAVSAPSTPAPAAPAPAGQPSDAPASAAPPVVPVASAALAAAALAEAAESALAAAPAAPVASATRAAKAAKAARATRANRPARVARGVAAGAVVGTTTTSSAPEPAAVPAAQQSAPAPAREPETAVSSPAPASAPANAAAAVATPPPATTPATEAPGPSDHATPPPVDEEGGADEPAPQASVLGRRGWPAWLGVGVIVGACAVRTALGLLFTYPGYLSWLPVVLVAVVALLKVARFSIGLVGLATASAAAWWVVDHVVSTARLQSLGYDVGQSTITVPGLVAAIGSVPLAVVLCALVDGHVRATVRAWVVPRSGPSPVRAAAVVLAVLAALFPVAGSVSTAPGFAVLTAPRDQIRYPGYPTPGEIAERMHTMSVSKGRPVSVTCTYTLMDGGPRPSYQCVAISQVGGEAAQVHDGIRATALPDGTYSCVDLTSGVDRRLC